MHHLWNQKKSALILAVALSAFVVAVLTAGFYITLNRVSDSVIERDCSGFYVQLHNSGSGRPVAIRKVTADKQGWLNPVALSFENSQWRPDDGTGLHAGDEVLVIHEPVNLWRHLRAGRAP